MIIDLHIHTNQSPFCGWIKPKKLIARALEIGLDGLAVTDHNTIDGALEIIDIVKDENIDLIVVIGEEITTDRGEVLAYFLKKEICPGPFTDVLKEIRRVKGISAIPHPFDDLRHHSVCMTINDIQSFDCVEVFNSRCFSKRENDLASNFAKKHNLAVTAGSDAHFLNEVGNSGVIIQQQNIRDAIIKGELTVFGQRSMVMNHVGTKILKFGRNVKRVLYEQRKTYRL
jgi:predicted metal-dependent phosphoesterase TrpH